MNGTKTVLVADDDQNDVFFLRRAFDKAGLPYPVHDVRDGQEAIDYLSGSAHFQDRSQFPLPDLLLLDLKMPRMSGFDVLRWLESRNDLKDLPVVVLSSSNQPSDIEKAQALGADDYLVKPTHFDELMDLARKITSRWLNSKTKT
jgi:CheY-like chemotaxis protein